MRASDLLLLALAGVAAGVLGSVVGLASLVSYPALLLTGLSPVSANVTNTVAMVGSGLGAATASRVELAGRRRYLLRLCALSAVGGAAGAGLLLTTPPGVFELVVPWLVGAASVLVLLAPRLRRVEGGHRGAGPGILLVSGYGGYFGAAAGVLLVGVLSATEHEPLPRTVAAKNVALGVANASASVLFAVFGPVHWAAAAALAAGTLAGGRLGPAVVRRVPPDRLRLTIALAGLGLATKLAVDAYT